jgi:hypothetical protein
MDAKDSINKLFELAKEKAGEKLEELGDEVLDELKNEGKQMAKKRIGKYLGNKDSEANENVVAQHSSQKTISKDTKGGGIEIGEEMTKEEEDKFLDQMESSLMKAGSGGMMNALQAINVVNTLINTAGDVIKFTEVQETKRAEIESKRQQAIARIEAEKRLLMLYLEKTFDERKEIFKQQFRVLDDALRNRDNGELSIVLESINKLAASSPFKDLISIEKTSVALQDKNTVWDL